MGRFAGRWGQSLTEAYLPQTIVKEGKFTLSTPALAILIVLFDAQKGAAYNRERASNPLQDHACATTRTSRDVIMERTGYSINPVTEGIRELKEAGWVEQSDNHEARDKRGHFKPAEYTLMNPLTEKALPEHGRRNPLLGQLRYFTFPKAMIVEPWQRWSLAQMSASELRVYMALAYLANEARSNEFPTSPAAIARLTDMDPRPVVKALEGLEERRLIQLSADRKECVLCDPYTGSPLEIPSGDPEDDAKNYKTVHNGVTRRASVNLGPTEIEKLIRSLVPDDQITMDGDNNLFIRCPFHKEKTPSCAISLKKGGIWYCHGCKQGGPKLADIVQKLSGSTKIEAFQQIGKAGGVDVKYRRPDTEAEAIYRYKDRYGNVLKEVVRYPNKPDGSKDIVQRVPVPGGYKYSVKGMKPMLYNLDLLAQRVPDTVVIVEGEKDADSVTLIGLRGRYGPVIGVTSGGANTWHPSLAKELRGMHVIVMPDSDEAGQQYAAEIIASLMAEGIEFRQVSFAGTGAKDVTDYLAEHSIEDLIALVGDDWVTLQSEEQSTEFVGAQIALDPGLGGVTL